MLEYIITPHVGSCYATFHSSLTFQSYERQLNMLLNRKTPLDMYSVLIPKYLGG